MTNRPILVTTWNDGIFIVTGNAVQHELAGCAVRSPLGDGAGRILAIVGEHSLCLRSSHGEWTPIATSEVSISCCISVGNALFVGTDDARILRVDSDGTRRYLTSFDAVQGRDRWYAGRAIVDGKEVGPPLGIRSMAATCDGTALLANVHVGGIPRSTDGGSTWQATIDIDCDVHQVCTHPSRPDLAIAAAGAGFCISRDAGATWTVEQRGLHAPHCSAVAFGANNVFVSASVDPFSERGAVYRRPIESDGPLQPLGGGMPEWLSGKADTGCIAARESLIAVIDWSGCLYSSNDDGDTWSDPLDLGTAPSGLHIF